MHMNGIILVSTVPNLMDFACTMGSTAAVMSMNSVLSRTMSRSSGNYLKMILMSFMMEKERERTSYRLKGA